MAKDRPDLCLSSNELAKVESDAVRYAVQIRAARHGLDVGLTRRYQSPEDLIPGSVLDDCAHDLPNLLSQLELKPPKGSHDQWLDNRNVLNALIETLRTQPDPLIRYQCAGWLRRSALSKTIEVQIPTQPWRSRALSALEVLAESAVDPSEDALAHTLAKSVLAKEEFVLRLWKSRTEYVPLVFELLLALDKRLFAARPSTHQPDWYMSG